MKVVEYEDESGSRPFLRWFGKLNTPAALKVRTAIARMEAGNLGDVKSVGQGVNECRINYGPGYRVYFGREGETLIILLAGSTKKDQARVIVSAKTHWQDYKARKRKGET